MKLEIVADHIKFVRTVADGELVLVELTENAVDNTLKLKVVSSNTDSIAA